MAGMRRKRTDNNSLILWASGEKRKDGIRKDAILFPVPFYASCTWLLNVLCSVSVCERVCVLDMLEYSQSPHGFVGLHPKLHACARMCTNCIACMWWHASFASVYIFIYLFTLAPVLKHICLLSVTRLGVLLRVFLFRAIWIQWEFD